MFRKAFCLLAVLALAGVANAGLVAAWNFNTGNTTNIGTAGTDADGILVNGATIAALGPDGWATGTAAPGSRTFNGVLVLDGNLKQYMDVGGGGTDGWAYGDGIGEGQQGTPYTLVAFFRVKSGATDTMLQTIIGKGCETDDMSWSLQRRYNEPDVAIAMAPMAVEGGMAGTSGSMEGKWWHMVAAVYEPTGTWSSTLKLYIDNVVEASMSSWYCGSYKQNELPVYVGANAGAGTDLHPFHGLIDNVYIYDEALNAQQVADFYALIPVPEPATIALLGLGGLAALRRRR